MTTAPPVLLVDQELRSRANTVIPGGMYGHQAATTLPPGYPQFFGRGQGARIWDVDNNEYVDLMCSYGPIILGHQHPRVEAAVARQRSEADCQNGPSARMVELAELLVDRVLHADWAMFAKNGTDATTMACTIARSATGRRVVMAAHGAYHGAAPWCTPRPAGVTPEDRANLRYFTYNDVNDLHAVASNLDGDLAAVLVTPFRHDAGQDQELADPVFAHAVRELCDRTGAVLILDDVRCGLRLARGSSWEPLGVQPDLSAWSKAIANGYPIAAVLGAESLRESATSIYVTGSFWFSAVPMAAAIATTQALDEEDALTVMQDTGKALRDGMDEQAATLGLTIRQTGPVQMPYLTFDNDKDHVLGDIFAAACVRNGLFLHPRHNWFISAAMTSSDVHQALQATHMAFQHVSEFLAR